MSDQSQAAEKAAERILSATIAAFQIGALSHEHQAALREAFAIDIDSLLTSHTETIAALTRERDVWTHSAENTAKKNIELAEQLATVTAERDQISVYRDDWRTAEGKLSDAYLRLRVILKAFDTPTAPSGEQVWKHTEDKARELVSELSAHAAIIEGLKRQLENADKHKEYGWETARESHKQYEKERTELLALRLRVEELETDKSATSELRQEDYEARDRARAESSDLRARVAELERERGQ